MTLTMRTLALTSLTIFRHKEEQEEGRAGLIPFIHEPGWGPVTSDWVSAPEYPDMGGPTSTKMTAGKRPRFPTKWPRQTDY